MDGGKQRDYKSEKAEKLRSNVGEGKKGMEDRSGIRGPHVRTGGKVLYDERRSNELA